MLGTVEFRTHLLPVTRIKLLGNFIRNLKNTRFLEILRSVRRNLQFRSF